MPNRIPAPLAAPVTPPANPDKNYIGRAELSAFLTRGATTLVGIMSKAMAGDALSTRVLTLSGAAVPAVNPVLDAFDKVVESIEQGTDLSASYPDIARLIHAQDKRAEIVSQLAVTHDYRRLSRALRAREIHEEALFVASQNNELLPAERILLLDRLESMISASRKSIAAQSTSVKDIQAMLEQLDYTVEMQASGLRGSMKGTSPQGRELVRKLLTSVNKKVRDITE